MRRGIRPLVLVLIVFGLLIGWAIVAPILQAARPISPATACLSNLKQSSLALILYAGDENDRFAPRDHWMDASYPYTKTEAIWHCPTVPKGAYGYAFNGALSGAKAPKDAASTPLVYDSVNPIRNASDLVASLPLPGRHKGKNNVGYADGHARTVPARR